MTATLGLSACFGPAPDPLWDGEVRASATDAKEEVAEYIASIELLDATPVAAQEADLCLLDRNSVFGDPTPDFWRCGAYAINVFESPTDDLERLDDLVVTALQAMHPEIRIGFHGILRDELLSGESQRFAEAWIGGGHVSITVAIGRDSANIDRLFSYVGWRERLISSSGDDLITVPTRSAAPINCDCLQVWFMVAINYANVQEPRWPTYLDV